MGFHGFVLVHRVEGPRDTWIELCSTPRASSKMKWTVYYNTWDQEWESYDVGGDRYASFEDAMIRMDELAEQMGVVASNA